MPRIVWLCVVTLLGAAAFGDGMFIERPVSERVQGRGGVASTEQKGVVVELPNKREALLLQTTYQGPADQFAWVVPVPGRPEKSDVFLAEPKFIDELLKNTAPRIDTKIIDARRKPLWGNGFAASRSIPMGGMMKGAAKDEMGGPPGDEVPPPVTVYDRMEVGDYDVAVLSATEGHALASWLSDHGFRLPDSSSPILAHYVDQGWYFVALRLQAGKAQEQPLLKDVAPICIRFPASRLVYPLYISRASSRDNTALTLAVLSLSALTCDTYPEAQLSLGKWSARGGSYARIRREAVQAQSPSVVCEYRGPNGMPYADLSYKKDSWDSGDGRYFMPATLWTTRYWTLLKRDDMQDMTFSPTDSKDTMRLVVSRRAVIWAPFLSSSAGAVWTYGVLAVVCFLLAALGGARGYRLQPSHISVGAVLLAALVVSTLLFGPMGWALLVGLCIVYGLGAIGGQLREAEASPTPLSGRLGRSEIIEGVALAIGTVVFGHVVTLMLLDRTFFTGSTVGVWVSDLWRGETPLLATIPLLFAQLAWCLLALAWIRQGLRGGGWRGAWTLLPMGVLTLVIAAPLTSRFHGVQGLAHILRPEGQGALPPAQALIAALCTAVSSLAVVALLAVVSFLIAGPAVTETGRRLAQPLLLAVAGVIVLGTVASAVEMSTAHAGMSGYLETGRSELDSALAGFDRTLTGFIKANGCYPRALADMLPGASATEGLDSSGNVIALPGAVKPPEDEPDTAQSPDAAGTPRRPQPPLRALPRDPLTNRTDTWTYEPTGSPITDSGGFRIRVTQEPVTGSGSTSTRKPEQGLARDPGAIDFAHMRYYYLTPTPTDDFTWGEHDMTSTDPVWQQPQAWCRVFEAAGGLACALVNVTAHVAMVGSLPNGSPAFASSSDGTQFVTAQNFQRTALVRSYALRTHDFKQITTHPWAVQVEHIDWHPTQTLWLLTAARLDAQGVTGLYLLAPGGEPRLILERRYLRRARFSPDGKSILAVVGGPAESRPSQGTPGGSSSRRTPATDGASPAQLLRLSLDGAEIGKVPVDAPATRPWFSSEHGTALTVGSGARGTALLYISKRGDMQQIALPESAPTRPSEGHDPGSTVSDLWTDGREIVAVIGEMTGAVWRYRIADASWGHIADFNSAPMAPVIVGRDGSTDSIVLTIPPLRGRAVNDATTFAVRENGPKLEMLFIDLSDLQSSTRKVTIAERQYPATIDGVYWLRSFKVGDIISDEPFPSDVRSGHIVSEVDSDSLVMGDRRASLPSSDVPTLATGREANCYARLHRQ
jgi:hypothetical protein